MPPQKKRGAKMDLSKFQTTKATTTPPVTRYGAKLACTFAEAMGRETVNQYPQPQLQCVTQEKPVGVELKVVQQQNQKSVFNASQPIDVKAEEPEDVYKREVKAEESDEQDKEEVVDLSSGYEVLHALRQLHSKQAQAPYNEAVDWSRFELYCYTHAAQELGAPMKNKPREPTKASEDIAERWINVCKKYIFNPNESLVGGIPSEEQLLKIYIAPSFPKMDMTHVDQSKLLAFAKNTWNKRPQQEKQDYDVRCHFVSAWLKSHFPKLDSRIENELFQHIEEMRIRGYKKPPHHSTPLSVNGFCRYAMYGCPLEKAFGKCDLKHCKDIEVGSIIKSDVYCDSGFYKDVIWMKMPQSGLVQISSTQSIHERKAHPIVRGWNQRPPLPDLWERDAEKITEKSRFLMSFETLQDLIFKQFKVTLEWSHIAFLTSVHYTETYDCNIVFGWDHRADETCTYFDLLMDGKLDPVIVRRVSKCPLFSMPKSCRYIKPIDFVVFTNELWVDNWDNLYSKVLCELFLTLLEKQRHTYMDESDEKDGARNCKINEKVKSFLQDATIDDWCYARDRLVFLSKTHKTLREWAIALIMWERDHDDLPIDFSKLNPQSLSRYLKDKTALFLD